MLTGNMTKITESSRIASSDFFKPRHKKIDFAIFSAMPEELEYLENIFQGCKFEIVKAGNFNFKIYEYNNKKILLTQTGLGTTFAASISTFVCNHFNPNYIFLTGTAGGIKPELKIRDVVIAEKSFEAEIQGAFKLLEGTPFASCLEHPLNKQRFPSIYSANEELLDIANNLKFPDLKVYKGITVSSNTFPAPQELFEKLKNENPYSIDMETSAFYQVAWLLKIPALAVRGISNVLHHDGTDDKVHESDVHGSSKASAKVLLHIIDALILKLNAQKQLGSEIKSDTEKEVVKLINHLNLQPHPEGGFYSRSYQSKDEVKSSDKNRYNDEHRSAGTAIYYLLKGYDFSAWHTLKSDEIWHYCKGSSVKIHVLNKDGELKTRLLGDPLLNEEACFQVAIDAGDWFAAEVADKSSYSLVGCTVSPGFEFKDFKLADRNALSEHFPQHEAIIKQFTRIADNELNNEANESSRSMLLS